MQYSLGDLAERGSWRWHRRAPRATAARALRSAGCPIRRIPSRPITA